MNRMQLIITVSALALSAPAWAEDDMDGVYRPATETTIPGAAVTVGTYEHGGTISERTITQSDYGTPGMVQTQTVTTTTQNSAMTPVVAAPTAADLAPAGKGEPFPAHTAVNDELLDEHNQNGIAYITGGVGEAERAAMERLRSKYNFKLTNARVDGAFVGDTQVTILNAQGQALVQADTDPLFYAQLPDGKYTLQATYEGQTKSQSFTVRRNRPVELQLRWM